MADEHADFDARMRQSECDRLRRLFADAFGPDVLRQLPLRLEAVRSRGRAHASTGWNRFDSARRRRLS
jgi:hypothetical protein